MNSRKRHNERLIKQSEDLNVHPLTDQLVSTVARQDARAFPSDSVYLGKLCLLEILIDPNFPDDIPVSLDLVPRH